MSGALMATYQQLAVAFAHGSGAWLTDDEGRRYLDAVAGIAVCGLGHAHPELQKALAAQSNRLVHTSNLYRIPLQEELGAKLNRLAGMDRAFFCNSGAEANETAIKITRLYAHERDMRRPKIVVMQDAFHGRTLATLSATGSRKAQKGFAPLMPGFIRVPYGDIEAIRKVGRRHAEVVAVMLEPVQGESGVRIPYPGFLRDVRALCDAEGWLMLLDEVQSGMCRTGRWFACQHEEVLPDVMTLAKALGNGVPIGACLARGQAATLMRPGSHGSTFGGNPLAARAALTVIEIMERDRLWQRAATLGERMLRGLQQGLAGLRGVREVRGKGMMLGIELDRQCQELPAAALEAGLLINVTGGNVIRLLPPLVISDEEAQLIVDGVVRVVKKFLGAGD